MRALNVLPAHVAGAAEGRFQCCARCGVLLWERGNTVTVRPDGTNVPAEPYAAGTHVLTGAVTYEGSVAVPCDHPVWGSRPPHGFGARQAT